MDIDQISELIKLSMPVDGEIVEEWIRSGRVFDLTNEKIGGILFKKIGEGFNIKRMLEYENAYENCKIVPETQQKDQSSSLDSNSSSTTTPVEIERSTKKRQKKKRQKKRQKEETERRDEQQNTDNDAKKLDETTESSKQRDEKSISNEIQRVENEQPDSTTKVENEQPDSTTIDTPFPQKDFYSGTEQKVLLGLGGCGREEFSEKENVYLDKKDFKTTEQVDKNSHLDNEHSHTPINRHGEKQNTKTHVPHDVCHSFLIYNRCGRRERGVRCNWTHPHRFGGVWWDPNRKTHTPNNNSYTHTNKSPTHSNTHIPHDVCHSFLIYNKCNRLEGGGRCNWTHPNRFGGVWWDPNRNTHKTPNKNSYTHGNKFPTHTNTTQTQNTPHNTRGVSTKNYFDILDQQFRGGEQKQNTQSFSPSPDRKQTQHNNKQPPTHKQGREHRPDSPRRSPITYNTKINSQSRVAITLYTDPLTKYRCGGPGGRV